jgi:HK97 family phage prohead protease
MRHEPRSRPALLLQLSQAAMPATWGVRHLTPGGTSPQDRRPPVSCPAPSRPGGLFVERVGMSRNRAPIGLRRTTTFIGTSTKFFSTVGERQVKVIASDGSVDRMGDILVPSGVELDEYRRNPIVLAQHSSDEPIARCSYIGVEGGAVVATVDFPPAGISERSDEYLALLKAGVLNAFSVGFVPLEMEPLRDTGGWRYRRWALYELSCVSIPANANALVVERRYRRGVAERSPAARPRSTLDYAGTFEQRRSQLAWHEANSPEGRARRRRIVQVRRHQAWFSAWLRSEGNV